MRTLLATEDGANLQPVATGPNSFVIADLHFGDGTLCGTSRRPFRDAADMDAEILRRWNAIVHDEDVVYILGDIGRRGNFRTAQQLKGRKHLVAGNADDLVAIARSGIFISISVAKWLPGVLLTHIPVHPDQLGRRTINVHGHLHAAQVNDPRYRCVSVDQTGFAPVCLGSLSRHPAHRGQL